MGRPEKLHQQTRITSGTLRITITLTLLYIIFQISVFNYHTAMIAATTLILQLPLLLVSEYILYQIEKLIR
jgi:hypothetical protein